MTPLIVRAADTPWVDDAVPAGATTGADGGDSWTWITSNPTPFLGSKCQQSNTNSGEHQHYFYNATTPLTINTGDTLYAYIYVEPNEAPSTVMLQWYDTTGSWNHRAYWGSANNTGWGPPAVQEGTTIPATGQWVRLEVPASDVGLAGMQISGMAFTLAGGSAAWDDAGKSSGGGTVTVWVDDAIPAGASYASGNDPWNWVSSNPTPYSGTLAHQSGVSSGELDHGFGFATNLLSINPGDQLFTYVYLDTTHTPTEIMLSFQTTEASNNFEHRAYWGADNITAYGTDGTVSRTNIGPLPTAGGWAVLQCSASQVGLAGLSLQGMFFTTYGGRATFDYTGKSSGSSSGGSTSTPESTDVDYYQLDLPTTNDYYLHILSPTLLELIRMNTKQPDPGAVDCWNFVDSNFNYTAPSTSEFSVTVNGQSVPLTGAVGFKRRPFYAPWPNRDLRIVNCLYLQLPSANAIAANQIVEVNNPDGTLWPSNMLFTNVASPSRYSPAIHVNQEGYLPGYQKQAMVGYYLGNLGEMPIPTSGGFSLVNVSNGTVAYTGTLALRPDIGYEYSATPYQQVYQADFSGFNTPGEYQLQVPGLGGSLQFVIDPGIAMDFARAYALGMYHQRCGTSNALPYTRFVHSACHTNLALVPVPSSSSTYTQAWGIINNYGTMSNEHWPQSGPEITSNLNSVLPMFQYQNTGPLNVTGGHHDAGDYSKYTINVASLIHTLIFSVDSLAGVSNLDNLGIPESGDGISDVLQEAKWEADFLAKIQDSDGGFYFLVYPLNGEYEDGPPDDGIQQIVWPKNAAVTAASVAALAEISSSPLFKHFYPSSAASYWSKAQAGWTFLSNAFKVYDPNGFYHDGAYQNLTFYGNDFLHHDEMAWAACEMYLASGNSFYYNQLTNIWMPDPTSSSTWTNEIRESYGNAIRSYAFAARSGRLSLGQLDPHYLGICSNELILMGSNMVAWAQSNAYATSFSTTSKSQRQAGWYFSLSQAFDIAVAYQLNQNSNYLNAILGNMNYEGGCNPVNVCYDEGLGWKRQRSIVSQYGVWGSTRAYPPSGITVGNIQAGFIYLSDYFSSQYGNELTNVTFPSEGAQSNPYPYYDRWADSFNLTTEAITMNLARALGAMTLVAAQTSLASQSWSNGVATITVPSTNTVLGQSLTTSLHVGGNLSPSNARIVWENEGLNPAFGIGTNYTFTPINEGSNWIELEIQWPDGRRVFATNVFDVYATNVLWVNGGLPPGAQGSGTWSWVTFSPAAQCGSTVLQSDSASGTHQYFFTGATQTLAVGANDTLYCYIYVNSGNIPSEVMLQWHDTANGWAHREFWGAQDQTGFGTPGTTSCLQMATSVPAGGQWIELQVPASQGGLTGLTIDGMAFTLYGGQANWDCAGKSSPLQ